MMFKTQASNLREGSRLSIQKHANDNHKLTLKVNASSSFVSKNEPSKRHSSNGSVMISSSLIGGSSYAVSKQATTSLTKPEILSNKMIGEALKLPIMFHGG